jgi:hypothetical protein
MNETKEAYLVEEPRQPEMIDFVDFASFRFLFAV